VRVMSKCGERENNGGGSCVYLWFVNKMMLLSVSFDYNVMLSALLDG